MTVIHNFIEAGKLIIGKRKSIYRNASENV